jgi:integrase
MKGFVRQRSEGGTWTAYWETRDPATGKRRQHTKGGFRTKGAAQGHLNVVVGKVQADEWTPDEKLTVRELLENWLAAKESKGLKPTTLAQYSKITNAWLVPHIGATPLRSLTEKDAENLVKLLRERGGRSGAPLSARSVQLAIIVLKAATSWAEKTRKVGRDPLLGFERPQAKATKGATDAWTSEEARTFLASVAEDRLLAAWSLLLGRGLRRGELAGLRWDSVDLDGSSLQITRARVLVNGNPIDTTPKTEAGKRRIPLDDFLVSRLRSHRSQQAAERLAAGPAWSDESYVFADQLGAPLHPEYISTRFERLTDRAGLRRIRLHDLRHTAASLMLAAGEPPKVVAEILGHSSVTMVLNVYGHVLPGMSEAAGGRLSEALFG